MEGMWRRRRRWWTIKVHAALHIVSEAPASSTKNYCYRLHILDCHCQHPNDRITSGIRFAAACFIISVTTSCANAEI